MKPSLSSLSLRALPALLFLFLFSAGPSSAQDTPELNQAEFLKSAMMNGLHADNFPMDLTKQLIAEDGLWVQKCPICRSVKQGMQTYVNKNSYQPAVNTSPERIAEFGFQGDFKTRKLGLKALVDRYVQKEFDRLALSEEARDNLENKLIMGRKKGMSMANGGEGFFCAACDGACNKPE